MVRGFIAAVLLAAFSASASAQEIVPPAQPVSGFGSSEYPFAGVQFHSHLEGAEQYWIFEPDTYIKPVPVVVFLHGWGAMNPKGYGNWIRHIVRRGAVVVFPRYQSRLRTPVDDMQKNMLTSLSHAFTQLRTHHPNASVDNLVVVGHSLGGVLAVNLAAVAADNGFPAPKAVLSIQPGKTWGLRNARIKLEDMSRIPAGTLLGVMTGNDDKVCEDKDAKRIYNEATSVPAHQKFFLEVRSDKRDGRSLSANHFSPAAPHPAFDMKAEFVTDDRKAAVGAINAARDIVLADRKGGFEPVFGMDIPYKIYTDMANTLDFYAYWKTLDMLIYASIYGHPEILADKDTLTFMGHWSDGSPFAPMDLQ